MESVPCALLPLSVPVIVEVARVLTALVVTLNEPFCLPAPTSTVAGRPTDAPVDERPTVTLATGTAFKVTKPTEGDPPTTYSGERAKAVTWKGVTWSGCGNLFRPSVAVIVALWVVLTCRWVTVNV